MFGFSAVRHAGHQLLDEGLHPHALCWKGESQPQEPREAPVFLPFPFSLFAAVTCTGLGLLAHPSLGTWWLFFLGWNPKSGISRTERAHGCLKLCPTSLKRLLKVIVVFMPTAGPTRAQSPGLQAALLLQGPGCHPLLPALASGALSFSLCTHLSASLLKPTALKT